MVLQIKKIMEAFKEFLFKTDWMKTFVGMVVMNVFVLVVVWLLMKPVPTENKEIIHLIIGEVVGMALMLPNYYFGSSKGSQEKQKTLDRQNEKINP